MFTCVLSVSPHKTKSRDITLPTKVHLVKAIGFPVVIYGCERWLSLSQLREPLLLKFNRENSSESLWPLNSTSAVLQIPTRMKPVWAIWLQLKIGATALEIKAGFATIPLRQMDRANLKTAAKNPGRILTPGTQPGTPPQDLPGYRDRLGGRCSLLLQDKKSQLASTPSDP